MPRVSGQYTLPPGYFAVSGEIIQPSQHNPPLEDIEQALTDSLPRDGSAGMSGNLPMGGNRITGLAAATAAGHAPRYDQVVPVTGGTVTGSITFTGAGININQPWYMLSVGQLEGVAFRVRNSDNVSTHQILSEDINNPTVPSNATSILTRQMGDGRYMRQTWNLTAGDGLSGGGTGAANRTLAVDGTVVRTSRQINTGTGLTGGGNLGANRTLSIDFGPLPLATGTMTLPRLIAMDGSDHVRIAEGPLKSNFNIAGSGTTITAGAGLTGGGTLANDRTVSMGTPSGITRTSTNSASGTTHTHNLPQAAFRDMMANYIVPGQIGSMCYLKNESATNVAFGGTLAGANLRPAADNGIVSGPTQSGTWQCCGNGISQGSTQWMRVS